MIDRSGHDGRSSETKNPASLIKSRIFDPCDFTRVDQRHCADHHRLLRAGGDNDLICMTAGAPIIAQISSDRLAQIGVAAARGILEQMGAFPGQDLCSEVFPDFNWKFVERGQRRYKGDPGRSGDSVIERFSGAFVGKSSDSIRKTERALNQPGRLWTAWA